MFGAWNTTTTHRVNCRGILMAGEHSKAGKAERLPQEI